MDYKSFEKALRRLNPQVDDHVDFDTDPDFKNCCDALAKRDGDFRRVYNILDWALDRQQDRLEGKAQYDEAFEDYERLGAGIKMVQGGSLKVRQALEGSDEPGSYEVLSKLKKFEEAIMSYKAHKVPELKNPEGGQTTAGYVNAATVALVDLLQRSFPPRRKGEVSGKACRYAGLFLYAAGVIGKDSYCEANIRHRYVTAKK